MPFGLLITAGELEALLGGANPDVLVLDCRFDLTDPTAGSRSHGAGHIPGAVHVDLDRDLSGARTGRNGRHPLPSAETFAARLAALGANETTQIVAYDQSGGLFAARLWWMARWIGHDAAAVLDGGLDAWIAAGLPMERDLPAPRPRGNLSIRTRGRTTVDFDDVRRNLTTGERLVIDARSADRFRGENETLDPIGGHIPGARNRFYRDNLEADGRFKSAAALRTDWDRVLGPTDPALVVSQCGSGVTACHNLLALEIAGLAGAALYPGSWSEWSARAAPDEIAMAGEGTANPAGDSR